MRPRSFSLAAAQPLSQPQWEKSLAVSSESRPTDVGRPSAIGQRLARFLRRRHPAKTAAHVAAAAGLPLATVERMLERESCPNFTTMGRLLAAYGPALLAETMDHPPRWLVEAAGRHQEAP